MKKAPGQVRIIGGKWRNTRLTVSDVAGLRPTSDRTRETLFNWLQPVLPGARVLDLFAGSGALGLEALSRGAAAAVLVERDRAASDALRQVVGRLEGGDAAQVVCADALAYLARPGVGPFDVVFVDPPFAAQLWAPVLEALPAVLAPQAWLYVEALPQCNIGYDGQWLPHREGSSRDTRFQLLRRA